MWEWLTKMKSEIDLLDAVAGILVLLLTAFGLWRNFRKSDKNYKDISEINDNPPTSEINQTIVNKLSEEAKESGKLQQKSDDDDSLLPIIN